MHRSSTSHLHILLLCATRGSGLRFHPIRTLTNPPTPPPPTTPSSVTEPSVYVMGDSTGPWPSVLVFPETASGQTSATL